MEREGEGRGRGRRRGGGEMRRGMIVGGMVIGLLMGCNNGGESAEGNLSRAMMDIGKNVESLFYNFIDLTSNALGFSITGTTKKKAIGTYYEKISNGIEKIKTELDKINLTELGTKTTEINTTIDNSKKTLETLKKHVDELKTIGNDNSLTIGEAANNNYGATVDDSELKKTIEALKGIVELAKESKVIKGLNGLSAEMSSVKGTTPQNGAKILGTSETPGANDEGKATAILSKVSGEEILAAIIASNHDDTVGRSGADGNTSAIAFAKGDSGTNLAKDTAKISAVAGGIALCSILKNGKLGAHTDGKEVAQGIGISAVSKLVLKVEDLIKRTIQAVLETVKTATADIGNAKK